MRIPTHFDWPHKLRAFKGDATERYVLETMSSATTCAGCEDTFTPSDARSLTVDLVTNEPVTPPAMVHRSFTTYVTHTRCKTAELGVTHDPELAPPATADVEYLHATLLLDGAPLPLLVYRFLRHTQFSTDGRGHTDAHVATQLQLGMTLIMDPDISGIVRAAATAKFVRDAHIGWTPPNRLRLTATVEDETHTIVEIDTDDEFRHTVETVGEVLCITGTGLEINTVEGTFDLARAAQQGTLVAGIVPAR